MAVAAEQTAAAARLIESGDTAIGSFLPEPARVDRITADFVRQCTLASNQGPLSGTLVGVKDIIRVGGLSTRAGSDLPEELFAGPEASAVTRLLSAGALIAGKTTTTEFAFSEPPHTRNPRNPNHTPGGSSSGSAAAVAAGFVPLALGTQTVDSIVTPASYCGVVGFKPSYARIPIDGVIPFSPSMDHVGLLARDVTTAELAASVLCDDWSAQPNTVDEVLGVPGEGYLAKTQPAALASFRKTLAALADSGLRVVPTRALEDIDTLVSVHRRINAAEFARVHRDWFHRYSRLYRPKTAALVAEGATLPETVIDEGRRSGVQLRQTLEVRMGIEGINVWISPATTGPAPLGLGFIGDPIMSVPWTHAHMPVVSLPAGTVADGLPLGIQLAARHGHDEELLTLARRVESALGRADNLA